MPLAARLIHKSGNGGDEDMVLTGPLGSPSSRVAHFEEMLGTQQSKRRVDAVNFQQPSIAVLQQLQQLVTHSQHIFEGLLETTSAMQTRIEGLRQRSEAVVSQWPQTNETILMQVATAPREGAVDNDEALVTHHYDSLAQPSCQLLSPQSRPDWMRLHCSDVGGSCGRKVQQNPNFNQIDALVQFYNATIVPKYEQSAQASSSAVSTHARTNSVCTVNAPTAILDDTCVSRFSCPQFFLNEWARVETLRNEAGEAKRMAAKKQRRAKLRGSKGGDVDGQGRRKSRGKQRKKLAGGHRREHSSTVESWHHAAEGDADNSGVVGAEGQDEHLLVPQLHWKDRITRNPSGSSSAGGSVHNSPESSTPSGGSGSTPGSGGSAPSDSGTAGTGTNHRRRSSVVQTMKARRQSSMLHPPGDPGEVEEDEEASPKSTGTEKDDSGAAKQQSPGRAAPPQRTASTKRRAAPPPPPPLPEASSALAHDNDDAEAIVQDAAAATAVAAPQIDTSPENPAPPLLQHGSGSGRHRSSSGKRKSLKLAVEDAAAVNALATATDGGGLPPLSPQPNVFSPISSRTRGSVTKRVPPPPPPLSPAAGVAVAEPGGVAGGRTSTPRMASTPRSKYIKMLHMLPEGAVRQRMLRDGCSEADFEECLKRFKKQTERASSATKAAEAGGREDEEAAVVDPSGAGTGAGTGSLPRPLSVGKPRTAQPRPTSLARNQVQPPLPPDKATGEVHDLRASLQGLSVDGLDETNVAKYRKMLSMLPEGAVRQKMERDGCNAAQIEALVGGVGAVDSGAAASAGSATSRPTAPPAGQGGDVFASIRARGGQRQHDSDDVSPAVGAPTPAAPPAPTPAPAAAGDVFAAIRAGGHKLKATAPASGGGDNADGKAAVKGAVQKPADLMDAIRRGPALRKVVAPVASEKKSTLGAFSGAAVEAILARRKRLEQDDSDEEEDDGEE